MDKLIEDEIKLLGHELDIDLVKKSFNENPNIAIKDRHLFDTLYSIIDFVKFKELMLAYNSNNIDKTCSYENTQGNIHEFRKLLIQDGLKLLEGSNEDIWTLYMKNNEKQMVYTTTDNDELQKSMKILDFSNNKLFKFDIIIENVEYEKIVKMRTDFELMKKF